MWFWATFFCSLIRPMGRALICWFRLGDMDSNPVQPNNQGLKEPGKIIRRPCYCWPYLLHPFLPMEWHVQCRRNLTGGLVHLFYGGRGLLQAHSNSLLAIAVTIHKKKYILWGFSFVEKENTLKCPSDLPSWEKGWLNTDKSTHQYSLLTI